MRRIFVFVGNKLISTDAVLPLLFELAAEPGVGDIRVFTLDGPTYDAVTRNRVLHDGISSIGSFQLIGSRRRSWLGRLAHRIAVLPYMLRLLLITLLGDVTLLHFGSLNRWPLRVLFWVNRRRTFLVQQATGGYSQAELAMDHLLRPRKVDGRLPAAGGLLAFQNDWGPLLDQRLQDLPRYVIATTQNLPNWVRFLNERADDYFAEEFAATGVAPSREVLAVMLGYFGRLDFLPTLNTTMELFHETIEALLEIGEGRPVLIKPHAVTDAALLADAMVRYKGKPVLITHLHPALLASRSRLFVANYYSSTLFTARLSGVPSIEYTDYTDLALLKTNGGSMRPDVVTHFVRRNPQALRSAIKACLSTQPGAMLSARMDRALIGRLIGIDGKPADAGLKGRKVVQ